ncbi:MAG: hypothetical protein KZQ89_21485 [Candidatus Thiodiazotropha sp. (ex Lucinoma kastoroae)]|nr:hypothetical protein [Candidatus Thiodiazotropha sp. (ex Lucinoma kastoroae)]
MSKATFCIFILSVSLFFHGSVLGGETLPNGSYRQSCGNCMLRPHLLINDVWVENVLTCACLTDAALKGLGGGGPKEWLQVSL